MGSKTEELPSRLPTEAEPENLCRAGSTGRWASGDDPASLRQTCLARCHGVENVITVGQMRPNAFGLYEMHDNVATLRTGASPSEAWNLARVGGIDRGDRVRIPSARRSGTPE
jgi:hypothetical protein